MVTPLGVVLCLTDSKYLLHSLRMVAKRYDLVKTVSTETFAGAR
jgi:hypothetical protein